MWPPPLPCAPCPASLWESGVCCSVEAAVVSSLWSWSSSHLLNWRLPLRNMEPPSVLVEAWSWCHRAFKKQTTTKKQVQKLLCLTEVCCCRCSRTLLLPEFAVVSVSTSDSAGPLLCRNGQSPIEESFEDEVSLSSDLHQGGGGDRGV